ncbi:MAG: hypothetical protein HY757_06280 [Nitrospirae bacterium]|nr:hypothetical protein [Nitrospirota bacterium]
MKATRGYLKGIDTTVEMENSEMTNMNEMTSELENVGSPLEIGNILFKDSRDITQDEATAMHTYCNRKYKKA